MKEWSPDFGPLYTPMEMLDLGIMQDSYYFASAKVAAKYKNHKKALKRGDTKDPKQNKFGVSSRERLWQWRARNKIRTDKCGWIEWYCNYFEGRRLGAEDDWQIKRWRSFVARHQGQITKSGDIKDLTKRLKQRQALLHWGWDSTVKWSADDVLANAKKMAKKAGATVTVTGNEQYPTYASW